MTAFNFFKRLHCDIIFLQEMHWTAKLENTINSEWNGEIIYNHGTANSCGVAILFHAGLANQPRQPKCDSHSRILATKITLDNQELNLVNIYVPRSNTERQSFYRSLSDYLTDDDNNIIAGDFNSISDPQCDKSGGNANARQSANTVLQAISAQFHLIDIWRSHHYNQLCYSWTGKNPTDNSIIRTRIDKFLLSTAISHLVTDSAIKPYPFSDHDYFSIKLNMDNIQRGPGYWHLNNELLQDACFEAEIKDFWTQLETQYNTFHDPRLWWDKAKKHFNNIAIHRASINNEIKRHAKLQLTRRLTKLHARSSSCLDHDIENYLLAKEQLKQFELKELEAIQLRSKARFLEEGECSTSYFYSLEKKRKADQTIHLLTKDNLDMISAPFDLLQETHHFYQLLYSAEPHDKQASTNFLNIQTPTLTAAERTSCEEQLNENELLEALNTMENNKSPDFDGLTTNFYKHFWLLLVPD